ncbi:hypothetical protein [Clostridium weizhouense]|uniref:Uncharacterized protein n=1 Tax=Clostridium weizhouense TaxID=2859781 RepID=A0ABS7AL81_9CLOT|nr:hypothetical protein [Clostridium weizhouense]MBW6409416.1 hypothetical protein [Clostridium weizhouense]
MNKEKNKFFIYIPLIVYLILIATYIYAYNKSSNIFWVAFIIERVFSYFYTEKITNLLDNIECENKSEFGLIVIVLILIFIGLGLIIYIGFNYPTLFVILIIGEIIDAIFNKIAYILTEDENIEKLK